eukprot:m.383977 g.383977  ORF g.383977 m.383977 type:complete len:758 (+) comp56262_c1_seq1:166-2439(+)
MRVRIGVGEVVTAVFFVLCVILSFYWWAAAQRLNSLSSTHILLLEHVLLPEHRDQLEAARTQHVHSTFGVTLSERADASTIPDGFVPIDISGLSETGDPSIELCQIPWALYSANPSLTPMSRDLVAKYCDSDHVMSVSLSTLSPVFPARTPAGLVFHQSRCGSTLAANMLVSMQRAMVHSECAILPKILQCPSCSEERKIYLLRTIVNAMGNSATYDRLFLKLQSTLTQEIDIVLKAFPATPWIFLFRDPNEILASYVEDATSNVLHCERTRAAPSQALVTFLSEHASSSLVKASSTEFCSAYFHVLASKALDAARHQHHSNLGRLVDYHNLSYTLTHEIIPHHFKIALTSFEVARLQNISSVYSKSRGKKEDWKDDSQRKQAVLTETDTKWIQEHMMPTHHIMKALSAVQHPPPTVRHTVAQPLFENQTIVSQLDVEIPSFLEEAQLPEYLPYPAMRPLIHFLNEWSPDDPSIPDIPGIAEGSLARFDYSNLPERAYALRFRTHEVPFMVYNVPELTHVSELWTQEYISKKFGDAKMGVTYSKSNHFMYFNHGLAKRTKDYEAPTGTVQMTYSEFLTKAIASLNQSFVDAEHFYLQLANFDPPTRWITADLPFFAPTPSFWIADPAENRGINCRFGSKGVIAETHYDGGRNFIALIKGAKRYVILPPSECPNLYLYPRAHPEGRHSEVDWSRINLDKYPRMADALATQVIIRQGEVLYLPSYWFHYPISLGLSIQCNTRSGTSIRGRHAIKACGFY